MVMSSQNNVRKYLQKDMNKFIMNTIYIPDIFWRISTLIFQYDGRIKREKGQRKPRNKYQIIFNF